MVWPDARPPVAQMKQINRGKTVLSMTNLQQKYVLTYYTPPDGRHLRRDWWRAGLD
jgi:hypothetical protein